MSVAGDLKCPYCGKINPRITGALGLVGGLKKTCLFCGKEFEMKSALAPKRKEETAEDKAQEMYLKMQLAKFTTEQLKSEIARRERESNK